MSFSPKQYVVITVIGAVIGGSCSKCCIAMKQCIACLGPSKALQTPTLSVRIDKYDHTSSCESVDSVSVTMNTGSPCPQCIT
jgi:hypothetical protein